MLHILKPSYIEAINKRLSPLCDLVCLISQVECSVLICFNSVGNFLRSKNVTFSSYEPVRMILLSISSLIIELILESKLLLLTEIGLLLLRISHSFIELSSLPVKKVFSSLIYKDHIPNSCDFTDDIFSFEV